MDIGFLTPDNINLPAADARSLPWPCVDMCTGRRKHGLHGFTQEIIRLSCTPETIEKYKHPIAGFQVRAAPQNALSPTHIARPSQTRDKTYWLRTRFFAIVNFFTWFYKSTKLRWALWPRPMVGDPPPPRCVRNHHWAWSERLAKTTSRYTRAQDGSPKQSVVSIRSIDSSVRFDPRKSNISDI